MSRSFKMLALFSRMSAIPHISHSRTINFDLKVAGRRKIVTGLLDIRLLHASPCRRQFQGAVSGGRGALHCLFGPRQFSKQSAISKLQHAKRGIPFFSGRVTKASASQPAEVSDNAAHKLANKKRRYELTSWDGPKIFRTIHGVQGECVDVGTGFLPLGLIPEHPVTQPTVKIGRGRPRKIKPLLDDHPLLHPSIDGSSSASDLIVLTSLTQTNTVVPSDGDYVLDTENDSETQDASDTLESEVLVVTEADGKGDAEGEVAASVVSIWPPYQLRPDGPAVIVGIDPDVSGAIAVIRSVDGVTEAEVIDMPAKTVKVNTTLRRRHNPHGMVESIKGLNLPPGYPIYLEQHYPLPGNGVMAVYSSGFGHGTWVGILTALGLEVIPVVPNQWKRGLKLGGGKEGKVASRTMATVLFPSLEDKLNRIKDDGRAEALLIAIYAHGYRPYPPKEKKETKKTSKAK